jgi:hypothetical protein
MMPYLDCEAMPVLKVFRRSLELELSFATLIHAFFPSLLMNPEIYVPPSLGTVDIEGNELTIYQPKTVTTAPHWTGKRPFVKNAKLASALEALVANKDQMIQEATMLPGDLGNLRRSAAGWNERPICTHCNEGAELSMFLNRPTRIMKSLGRLKTLKILESMLDSKSDFIVKNCKGNLNLLTIVESLKEKDDTPYSTNVVKGLYEYCFFSPLNQNRHLTIVTRLIELEKKVLVVLCKGVRHDDKTYKDLTVPEVDECFPHDPVESTFTHGKWKTFEAQYENQLKVAWTEVEVLANTIICPYTYWPLIIDFKTNSDGKADSGQTEPILNDFHDVNILALTANRFHCCMNCMTMMARQTQRLNQMASSELKLPYINHFLERDVDGDNRWSGLQQSILLKDCVLKRQTTDGVASETTLQSVMSRFLARDGSTRIMQKPKYADTVLRGEHVDLGLLLCEQFNYSELKLWELCVEEMLKDWTESIEAGPHRPKLFPEVLKREDEQMPTVNDFEGLIVHLDPKFKNKTLNSMWIMANGTDRALLMRDDWSLAPSPVLKCHNGCGRLLPKHLRPFWRERVYDGKCLCEHCSRQQGLLPNPTEGAMIQDRTAFTWDIATVQMPFDLWNMVRGNWASDDFYNRRDGVWTDPCDGLTCALTQHERVSLLQVETKMRMQIQHGDRQELVRIWNGHVDSNGNCTIPAWRSTPFFEPLWWKKTGWIPCPRIVNDESTWKDVLPLTAFKAYEQISSSVYPCAKNLYSKENFKYFEKFAKGGLSFTQYVEKNTAADEVIGSTAASSGS